MRSQGVAERLARRDHVARFVGDRRVGGGRGVGRRRQWIRGGNGMADAGLGGGLQFRNRAGGLFLGKRFAVPPFLVLQERDAGPLQSLGQDDQRLRAQAHRGQHFGDFLQVVPVNFLGAPAEGLEALLVRAEVVAKRGGLALAEPVHIHNRHEVVELVDARQRSRFPHRALRAFAVAEQDISPVVQIVEPRAQRHADPHGQALAQRAGRHIHERQARRRMAFQVAAELAELEQFLHREQPRLRPGRVQQRRGVAFGENEPVVVVVMGILRVVTHVPEEQGRDQVRRRTTRSRMPAARRRRRRNRMNPQLMRDAL